MTIEPTTSPDATPTVAELQQELARLRSQLDTLERDHRKEQQEREHVEKELRQSRRMLQVVMDTLPEAIFWKDCDLVYMGCNRHFADDAGLQNPEDVVGLNDFSMPWTQQESEFYRTCDRRVMDTRKAEYGISESQLNSDGEETWLETNKAPLFDCDGSVVGILGTYQDITQRHNAEVAMQELNHRLALKSEALAEALEKLQSSQLQLVQQEKMSTLGNLIAGVAHEINNPIGFLSSNIQPAEEYVRDLFELIDLYDRHTQELPADRTEEIEETIEEIDLSYIRDDLPAVFRSMHEGVNRIVGISDSLRVFSRADTVQRVSFDLHQGLDSTLMILRHRLKANSSRPEIQVLRHYGELPTVECFPGQINQVFMNLLANAIDAIEEANRGKTFEDIQQHPNLITIKTRLCSHNQWAEIDIRDNGCGIPPETRDRIFEKLFTTKEVGHGTGLGLAIAQQIVTKKHGGQLSLRSKIGKGTEFAIKIPRRGDSGESSGE